MLNTKVHLAVDAWGMPVYLTVTSGTIADSSQAHILISDIEAQYILADRGYDTNEIIEYANPRRMTVVIPPKRNRKYPIHYDKDIDKDIYANRYKIENAFLR